jgi:glycosyltransferase involved in cell wall biosynthesis
VPERSERDGILFFGRLTREKGVEHVLALSQQLPNRRVTIVGGGDLEETVKAACAERPSLHYVPHLRGNDLVDAVRSARIVVMPSLWQEPAGLAALEAMAAGTPVVAYANGGLADYVRDSGGGVVTEPRVDELVSSCEDLLRDDAQWDQCSRQGREAVHRRHSVEGYVEGITDLYKKAVYASRGVSI